MCGIGAIFQFRGDAVGPKELQSFCAAMAHRGPDGGGYARLFDDRVALINVRLAIMDPVGGVQPIFNEDRSVAVTCNGEVYDYLPTRRSLEREGHRFRTNSDSELLVHLYERDGTEFIKSLNGEFSFVLWDQTQRRMFAARDRAGVKPLYYYFDQSRFVAASEVKGIFAVPQVPRALSPDYFRTTGLGVVSENPSPFDGVHCLAPGSLIIVDENGIREEKYHEWRFNPDPTITFDEATALVRAEVVSSVKRRTVADVGVSCYLSGGLDSAIICGIMATEAPTVTAYHLSFPATSFDELDQARTVAEHFGVDLHVVGCTPHLMSTNLEVAVEHVELPLVNCNAIGKFMLSKFAHAHGTKVCLTGEGADEVFGGYAYFMLEALWRARLTNTISDPVFDQLWKDFQAQEHRSRGSVWHRTEGWRRGPYAFGYPSYHDIRAGENGSIAPLLFSGGGNRLALQRDHRRLFSPEKLSKLDPFDATRLIAFASLAGGLIPPLGDRVEMANSIEGRTPFLDPKVLAVTTRIPSHHFLDVQRLSEKRLLHAAFDEMLPTAAWSVHKHPFLAPPWRQVLNEPFGREICREYLSSESARDAGIYSPMAVSALRAVWNLAPIESNLSRRLDPLIGIIVTSHILYRRLVKAGQPTPSSRMPVDVSRLH